jgi:hypothetical protein
LQHTQAIIVENIQRAIMDQPEIRAGNLENILEPKRAALSQPLCGKGIEEKRVNRWQGGIAMQSGKIPASLVEQMTPFRGTFGGEGIGLRRTPQQTNGAERLLCVTGRWDLESGRFGQPGSSPQEQNRFPFGKDSLQLNWARNRDFDRSDSRCLQGAQGAANSNGVRRVTQEDKRL